MTTLELTQHPELAALVDELRKGQRVVITDHGAAVGEVTPSRPGHSALIARLEALQRRFTSPVYPGNSVVDMRRESR
jgi:antitoxin (DNA-binding transcriptional repressor) of toxin-antitoxin stability system